MSCTEGGVRMADLASMSCLVIRGANGLLPLCLATETSLAWALFRWTAAGSRFVFGECFS